MRASVADEELMFVLEGFLRLEKQIDVSLLLLDLVLHFLQLSFCLCSFILQLLFVCLAQVNVEQIVLFNLVEVVDEFLLSKVYL